MKKEITIQRLRNCRIFDGVSDIRLNEIVSLCSWQHLEPGQNASGRSQDKLFIVCQGKIRISALSQNGRELHITEFSQGDHFCVFDAIGASAVYLQAFALIPSVLACLTRNNFVKMIQEDSVLGRFLLQAQQAANERLIGRLVEMGTFKISGRLYSYLLELAEQAGVKDNLATLSPAPRHRDLAARIAASREEVSREMARLAKQGLIVSTRQSLVINDVAVLKMRLHAL